MKLSLRRNPSNFGPKGLATFGVDVTREGKTNGSTLLGLHATGMANRAFGTRFDLTWDPFKAIAMKTPPSVIALGVRNTPTDKITAPTTILLSSLKIRKW